MELLRKTYQLVFTFTVTANDEPILSPSTLTTIVNEDGTREPEDTQQVKRLLLAVLQGKEDILDDMIAQEIAYWFPEDGGNTFEIITGKEIETNSETLLDPIIQTLQREDKEHFEHYEGLDLIEKINPAFSIELEQVAFGEVQHQHTHSQNSPTEKKRHHKKKPNKR